MELHIHLSRKGNLSLQIYQQIRDAVMDGRLAPSQRLPPTRELARWLEVSRNTVSLAYEHLGADGILVGRVGDGSFVNSRDLGRQPQRHPPAGSITPKPSWNSISLPVTRPPGITYDYDFGVGIPDPLLFPFTEWRRLIAGEWRPSAEHGRYQTPAGHPSLRAAIARHIGLSRAVKAGADDVIVTQGAQQAFDLIGRTLISPGNCVAVEEPGYPFVRKLFQALGARIVGVPVDKEGLVIKAIPRAARILYVTPSHQFPLGYTMSFERRMQLLAHAERHSLIIIEDDYDSEFRFGGRPLDPLQTLDRNGCIIYVGSFSKILLPTLRIGFLIAPASLRSGLLVAKQLTDWHSDHTKQAALAKFIDQGLLARHIRKMNREYAPRYFQIADLLEGHFRNWLRVIPTASGIHVTAERREDSAVDVNAVVARARERGVFVLPLANYYHARPRMGLVVGYGAIQSAKIKDGMKILESAFHEVSG